MNEDISLDDLRVQMCCMISDYSETCWCAGWLIGIEDKVREIGGLWTLMAVACGGWPMGYEGDDGWASVTDDERAYAASLLNPDAAK